MKRYTLTVEYFDDNGSYETNYNDFSSLIAAKLFFFLHKNNDYSLIKITDNTTKKDIKKIIKR